MGNVYIFRGKAATGKSTLSDMLARHLGVPVIRKDDVVDALKATSALPQKHITNELCYRILQRIIQTNLNLGADCILDIALPDKGNANWFFGQLDYKGNRVFRFLMECSDEDEWKRRHAERQKNPLPHQSFRSFEQVVEHYQNADVTLFEGEHQIDSAKPLEQCWRAVVEIIGPRAAR